MLRFILVSFYLLGISNASDNQFDEKSKNFCIEAVSQKTSFRVTGYYGSILQSEWHPTAAYALLKEMRKFLILKRIFIKKTNDWRFEFAEMVGGKTIVFVYNKKIPKAFCRGSNAFFVERK